VVYHGVSLLFGENNDRPPDSQAGDLSASWRYTTPQCLNRFRAAPSHYLSRSPEHANMSTHALRASSRRTDESGIYTCPMHPDVRQQGPGSCPRCGMALEPVTGSPPAARTEYVCPMHPEIVRTEPGFCPICGMALEPRTVTGEEVNPESADMTRRFWMSLVLTLPLLFLAMSEMIPGRPVQHMLPAQGWCSRCFQSFTISFSAYIERLLMGLS
jgi:P-type Cu+ transporter